MKIFGFEVRKASNQPDIVKKQPFFTDFGELPDSTFDLFFKYFRRNSDVRRCIIELQENIGVGGYGYKVGEEVIYEMPAIDQKLKNFNDLRRRVIRDVGICGNCYILSLRNGMNKIIGYTTIDPRTVKIVADNTGEVKQYIQHINGKVANRYDPKDVYHCYDELDPDNEIFGLSVLEGIITEILADDEASMSNYHYFKNSTIPSMLLKINENASDDEMNNIIESMKKNFKGGQNKHKIGVLRGVDGIEKLQDSMADMQYTLLRDFTTQRVCASFGVPRVVLNYTDGVNYTNAEMQYKKFTTNTIFPRERKLDNWFNGALKSLFEQENIDAEFIVLKSTESINIDKVSTYEKMIQNGLVTINEARSELGYDAYEQIEEADKPLILKNYDLLTDVGLSLMPTDTEGS